MQVMFISKNTLYNLNFHQYSESIYQGFFLGVDVFFVISGYLITNILIDKLDRINTDQTLKLLPLPELDPYKVAINIAKKMS